MCCDACNSFPPTEHTDQCNAQLELIQTPANAQLLGELQAALSLIEEPEAFMKIDSRVEAAHPVEQLNNESLQALAASLGVKHVMMVGDVAAVSTQGRFSCYVSNERLYGCFICDTGPMARRSWCDHVFGAGHCEQVGRWAPEPNSGAASADPIDIAIREYEDAKRNNVHPYYTDDSASERDAEAAASTKVQANVQNQDGMREDEDIAWYHNMGTLLEWRKSHEGWPKQQASNTNERVLADWMHNQRAAFKENVLSAQRATALKDSVAGWSWDVHLDVWESNYASLRAWLSSREGKYPSKSAASNAEKLLGVWVTNQKSCYAGTRSPLLSEERVEKLEALPSFPFPVQHVEWVAMFVACRNWCKTYQQMPAANVHVQVKAKWLPLGRWCALQRRRLDDSSKQNEKQSKQLRELMSRYT